MNAKEFLNMTEIPVSVTLGYLPEPIVLPCKLALSTDDEAARQAFYAQAQGDIDAGLHAYHLDMLGRIMTGAPTGIPGFDDFVKDSLIADKTEGDTDTSPGDVNRDAIAIATIGVDRLAGYLKEYLSDPNSTNSTKIAGALLDRYNRITQPDELFR